MVEGEEEEEVVCGRTNASTNDETIGGASASLDGGLTLEVAERSRFRLRLFSLDIGGVAGCSAGLLPRVVFDPVAPSRWDAAMVVEGNSNGLGGGFGETTVGWGGNRDEAVAGET